MFQLFLFFFFKNLFQVSSNSLPKSAGCLLQFRSHLSEPSRLLLQWNQSISHCEWKGVSCNPNNKFHVESLNVSGFGITGNLGDSISSLCNLPHLHSLDLSNNNFTGSIPQLFGNCSQLEVILLSGNGIAAPIPRDIFQSKQLLELDLSSNLISGEIPPEVGLCTNLEYLFLNNNSLAGEIPEELFSLPNLYFLDLSRNNFSGPLPDFPSSCSIHDLWIFVNHFSGSLPLTLSNCKNLSSFHAELNSFEGIIQPGIFEGLTGLKKLYLPYNNLEGEIPDTLWRLPYIEEINLSDNKLNGTISEMIGQCRELTLIALSNNSLINQIPSSIGNLTKLSGLILSDNNLNGSIPPELGNCSFLTVIHLSDNLIGGTIPPDIYNLRNLKIFYTGNNQIEGYLPREMGGLSTIVKIDLSNNSLIGFVPEEITNLTTLEELTLARNHLTGMLPSGLGKSNFPGLSYLELVRNKFSGSIPSGLCTGNNLWTLAIGSNRFSGIVPAEIWNCKSLRRVILSNNFLQGSIPLDLDTGNGVSYFNIRRNLLTGNIPASIGLWSNLSMLDISQNRLSGPLPPQLGRLQNLQVLRLSFNKIIGSIPSGIANCTKMIELDLSGNSLSGNIPREIVAKANLQSLMLQDNKLGGFIPDSFSSIQSLFELNLGNNMLEGTIPCSLSKLQQFYLVLNVSNNRLSGEIPKCLGMLDKLEKLDLSNNNFSGQLPPELNNMISISFVNISYNNFAGKIPDTWMKIMRSNPESFLGNPELCIHDPYNSSCGRKRKDHTRGRILAPLIIVVVLSIALLSLSAYCFVTRGLRNQFSSAHSLVRESLSTTEDLPKELTLKDIIRATGKSSNSCVIGKGKHGIVYRMTSHWAVKKVNLSEPNFICEIRTLRSVMHRNVLKLAGYCINEGNGFIVTEFMPNGTLFDALHRSKDRTVLDWESLYCFALGIAHGLSYLHHDCVPQIIHRDIKSNNILLDSEMEPKIGDFGTAKSACETDESRSVIVGTPGYIAPENGYSTQLTAKCDVYSYGVILLELLCRKLPVDPSFGEGLDIVSWIRKGLKNTNDCFFILDVGIRSWCANDQFKGIKLLNLAFQCTQHAPEMRPSMRDVVGFLKDLDNTVDVLSTAVLDVDE